MLAGLTCSLLVARLLAEVSVALAALIGSGRPAGHGRAGLDRAPPLPASTATRCTRDGRSGMAGPKLLISVVVILTAVGALVFALLA